MGDIRTYAVSSCITDIRYELRDTATTYQYSDAELTAYINKCSEIIHEILVDKEAELVRTGSGTITTVAGTQSYNLESNSMGDLWVPHRVWVDTKSLMTMCEEWELYDAINQEEDSQTGHRTEPQKYCIVANYIWFKEVPDTAYTVRLKYYPNYTLLTTSSSMPFRHMFNQAIIEGVKILAKNRNEFDVQVDAVLKDYFETVANRLLRRRQYKPVFMRPAMRSYTRGHNYSRVR